MPQLLDPEKLFSLSGEAAVLGAMVIDSDCISKIIEYGLTANSFFLPENQKIYDALTAMFITGGKVDAVLLRDELVDGASLMLTS